MRRADADALDRSEMANRAARALRATEARRLYARGQSIRNIAAQLNVEPRSVYRYTRDLRELDDRPRCRRCGQVLQGLRSIRRGVGEDCAMRERAGLEVAS